MATEAEVNALADAMWQLLDDMGKHGTSACVAAKAQARIAYEPFREGVEFDDWMWLSEALAIMADIERTT